MHPNPCSATKLRSNERLIVLSKGAIGSIISKVKRFNETLSYAKYFSLLSYYDPSAYSIEENEKSYLDFSQELQKIRTNKLSWIANFWVAFILQCAHEVAHHVNGHLDFKNFYKHSIGMLNKSDASLLNRTLEFDADAFVASEGINYILGRYKIPPLFERLAHAERSVEITLMQTSAIVICQSPSILTPIEELEIPKSHDFSRWRALRILDTMEQCFVTRGNISDVEIYRNAKLGVIDTIRLSSHDFLNESYSPSEYERRENSKNLEEILSCWAAIRPNLCKFNEGIGNLAKAQIPPNPTFSDLRPYCE